MATWRPIQEINILEQQKKTPQGGFKSHTKTDADILVYQAEEEEDQEIGDEDF